KYDGILENHRSDVHARRRWLLMNGAEPALLLAFDDAWAEHLASVAELREGIHWRSWAGREPFSEFAHDAEAMFQDLMERLDELEVGEEPLPEHDRGATWTYLVTDQPFGTITDRQIRGMRVLLQQKGLLRR